MSRRSVFIASLTLAALVASSASAGADPQPPSGLTAGPWPESVAASAPVGISFAISRRDGNDVKGALDLRSMRIARGKGKDTITFTTHDPVSNADIEVRTANFAVLIDTNDDRRYDFGQYVFVAARRLRGLLVNLRTNRIVDRTAPTSRTGPAGFRTAIQRGKIDSPGTYRFALFGYNEGSPCSRRKPCIDAIPNRFPLIPLDHRAPTVDLEAVDAYASDGSETASIPFGFSVADDVFGTGIKRWVVQSKRVGAGEGWVVVDRGRGTSPTVDFPGEAGATFDLRVVVTDRQRNQKISGLRRTSFPFDDRDDSIVYAGTTVEAAPAGAYLTTTTTLAMGATATLDAAGSEVCVVGGPSGAAASASLTIDLTPVSTLDESAGTAARARLACVAVGAGNHTVVVTGTSAEPFVLDAIYVKPA